ncbi:MAG: 50S ribosomal protein L18 [Pelagibacteraceae bacterium]|nr:50S ribosomal protein L18 [Pelagibacteraceae bacterium]
MQDTRTKKTRYKLKKVSKRKRLSVFRSNNHLYAQVIDDEQGITLASASTLEKKLIQNDSSNKDLAKIIGKEIAARSIAKGIKEVLFDKGKYKYHGLVKILAEAARSEGLNF